MSCLINLGHCYVVRMKNFGRVISLELDKVKCFPGALNVGVVKESKDACDEYRGANSYSLA